MTLDKQTRIAINQTVRKAMQEAYEMYNEVWLTADELVKQVGFFSTEFVKHNGRMLPRDAIRWTDEKGVEHTGQFRYPKMKILRMINEGYFRDMRL